MHGDPLANVNNRKSSAYTLVELLVVIAIIGILTALLLAGVSQAKARVLRIQCANNLHQLGIGLQSFLANNRGYPLEMGDASGGWYDNMENNGLEISTTNILFFTNGVWRCPSARWTAPNLGPIIAFSYGCNFGGIGGNLGIGGHLGHAGKSTPTAESEVVAPSEMMAIGDDFSGAGTFRRENLDALLKATNGNTQARHQGRANVVFCDGHVETPTLHFLFADISDAALVRWNRDHQPHRELLPP